MHVIVEGMVVRCVSPVNGLRYGGRYRVLRVRREDMFYTEPPLIIKDLEGPTPFDSLVGYFAWRFVPEAVT